MCRVLQNVDTANQETLSTDSDEISQQLRDCPPKAIVTLTAILSTVQGAIKLTGTQAKPLIIISPGIELASDIPVGTVDLRQMLQDGVDTSDVRFTGSIDDTAIVLYSSGTTGLPKGVTLSHRNIVATITQANDRHEICPTDPALGMTLHFIQADLPDITGLSLVITHAIPPVFMSDRIVIACRFMRGSAWIAERGTDPYSVQSFLQQSP
jgi:acyl-CoA synthetase (AMP-forming)/AMP-acid ligase II